MSLKSAFCACNVSRAFSCSSTKLRFKFSTCFFDKTLWQRIPFLRLCVCNRGPARPKFHGTAPSFSKNHCAEVSKWGCGLRTLLQHSAAHHNKQESRMWRPGFETNIFPLHIMVPVYTMVPSLKPLVGSTVKPTTNVPSSQQTLYIPLQPWEDAHPNGRTKRRPQKHGTRSLATVWCL